MDIIVGIIFSALLLYTTFQGWKTCGKAVFQRAPSQIFAIFMLGMLAVAESFMLVSSFHLDSSLTVFFIIFGLSAHISFAIFLIVVIVLALGTTLYERLFKSAKPSEPETIV